MNLNRHLYLLLFLLLCFPCFGQDPVAAKAVVKYDPLFWKNELKLSIDQSQRIREINFEFYEQLMATFSHEGSSRNVMQLRVSQSLLRRSQQIWDTLYRKQRKKWAKIMRGSYIF